MPRINLVYYIKLSVCVQQHESGPYVVIWAEKRFSYSPLY